MDEKKSFNGKVSGHISGSNDPKIVLLIFVRRT